jgi:predicted nicotinamide N-methyase
MAQQSKCTVNITDGINLKILEDLQDETDEDVEGNVGRFIWPTALPMMTHLHEHVLKQTSTKETIVVELGAGCGVLSMGLVAMNTFCKVIITDHDEVWLQENLALNSALIGDEVVVKRLDWGNANEVEVVRRMIEEARDQASDPDLLIVASDVLYNHESHQNLASTLHRLSSCNVPTRIMIGFLNDRDDDEESFQRAAMEFFGDSFPASKSVLVERNERSRKMDVHIIDFVLK